MLKIKEIEIPGYEKVIEGEDPVRGLCCYIAVHNTQLGPALGGTRIHPYTSRQEALKDVLRLAKAMTYKSAVAEDGLGGGKSVIIADPAKAKTPELLHAFAEVVDSLQGLYIAAEDVGSNIADMALIRQKTPYVAALSTDKSSGDPSRFTAWGVFRGIQAVSKTIWHTKSLRGRTIAIEGLGSVGSKLANILFWEGARLIVCDIKEKLTHQAAHDYGAHIVSSEEFCSTPCDILAPCAMGGIFNKDTIAKLRCRAIAGAANNQLESEEAGQLLFNKQILYAPDYIINSGGIINASAEFEPNGYNPTFARDKVNHVYDILLQIFQKSGVENLPTNIVANLIAEHNLMRGIGKRKHQILFQ
jgi:leucine dehydrogenase